MPANAGIQGPPAVVSWTPAFAGVTKGRLSGASCLEQPFHRYRSTESLAQNVLSRYRRFRLIVFRTEVAFSALTRPVMV